MKANLPASQDAEARRQILDPFIGDDEALEASRIILSGLPEDQVAVLPCSGAVDTGTSARGKPCASVLCGTHCGHWGPNHCGRNRSPPAEE